MPWLLRGRPNGGKSIWLHDARGDRQISTLEGIAVNPKFSRDGKKLAYTRVRDVPTPFTKEPGEIWIVDVESRRSDRLAPGFQALDYDLSADGRIVVMEADDSEGARRLWFVALDRLDSPPVPIPDVEGREPRFGPSGEVFFRRTEEGSDFAYCVRTDGSGLRKAIEEPILVMGAVSPDGRWIVAWAPLPSAGWQAAHRAEGAGQQAFSLNGERTVPLSNSIQWTWSPSGDAFSISAGPVPPRRTYIIPLRHGRPCRQSQQGVGWSRRSRDFPVRAEPTRSRQFPVRPLMCMRFIGAPPSAISTAFLFDNSTSLRFAGLANRASAARNLRRTC